MSEWKELKTLQDVAAAQAAGEEIYKLISLPRTYAKWNGRMWSNLEIYRSRPRKKVKQIVLREALMQVNGCYWTTWTSDDIDPTFVKWLDTPERIIEVEEE